MRALLGTWPRGLGLNDIFPFFTKISQDLPIVSDDLALGHRPKLLEQRPDIIARHQVPVGQVADKYFHHFTVGLERSEMKILGFQMRSRQRNS